MSDFGFDRLVQALAASRERRQAVKASLGGMLAGGLTGISQAADATAATSPTAPAPGFARGQLSRRAVRRRRI